MNFNNTDCQGCGQTEKECRYWLRRHDEKCCDNCNHILS